MSLCVNYYHHRRVIVFCFLFSVVRTSLSFSVVLDPSVCSPSVFCPNWRLKREFYILATSNDERPLITVYPCRWWTAAATWDTSTVYLFFYVSSLSLLFILSHSRRRRGTQTTLDCGMSSTYCDLLFVKWAVNSGGIMLQHPVLWRFVSATFPTDAAVKSHRTIAKRVFLSAFWQTGHCGIFFFLPSKVRVGGSYFVWRIEQRFWQPLKPPVHRAARYSNLNLMCRPKIGNNRSWFDQTGWGNDRNTGFIIQRLVCSLTITARGQTQFSQWLTDEADADYYWTKDTNL